MVILAVAVESAHDYVELKVTEFEFHQSSPVFRKRQKDKDLLLSSLPLNTSKSGRTREGR